MLTLLVSEQTTSLLVVMIMPQISWFLSLLLQFLAACVCQFQHFSDPLRGSPSFWAGIAAASVVDVADKGADGFQEHLSVPGLLELDPRLCCHSVA